MSTEFKQGDTVYLSGGIQCEYLAHLPNGGHVVQQIKFNDEDEPFPGEIRKVIAVFTEAPRAAIEESIRALNENVAAKREELRAITADIDEAERANRERIIRLKSFNGLERVDDFLSGRITHLVMDAWSQIAVLPFADALKTDPQVDRSKLRLMTLFGDRDKALAWGLNRWSDGSGSDERVWPVCSWEEGVAQAGRVLDEIYAKIRGGKSAAFEHDKVKKTCATLGIEMPTDVSAMITKAREEAKAEKIAEHQRAIDGLLRSGA